jgi:hypothetical protein
MSLITIVFIKDIIEDFSKTYGMNSKGFSDNIMEVKKGKRK